MIYDSDSERILKITFAKVTVQDNGTQVFSDPQCTVKISAFLVQFVGSIMHGKGGTHDWYVTGPAVRVL